MPELLAAPGVVQTPMSSLKTPLSATGRRLRALLGRARGARADLERLRVRSALQDAKIRALKERSERLRARLAQPNAGETRSTLDPDVVWQVIELRAGAVRAASRAGDARKRHAELLAHSADYRAALETDAEGEQTEIGGLTWTVPLDSRVAGALSRRVLDRHWLPVREILAGRELAVGHTMIDIGANIGTTSIARVVLGDFSVAYAVEPELANYNALVQTIAQNELLGLVLPERLALGGEDGEASLAIGTSIGTHELLLDPNVDRNIPSTSVVTVPVARVDTWIARRGIDLDRLGFVKCDTQGWEGYVLRGASETLRSRHVVWQIELWPEGLETAGFALDEFVEIVSGAFTHVLDLRRRTPGRRIRKTSDMRELVAEIPPGKFTEILLYNGSELRS